MATLKQAAPVGTAEELSGLLARAGMKGDLQEATTMTRAGGMKDAKGHVDIHALLKTFNLS